MPELDPHPKNHLGKGVFTVAEETAFLAAGYVFVHRLPCGLLVRSKAPRHVVLVEGANDAYLSLYGGSVQPVRNSIAA